MLYRYDSYDGTDDEGATTWHPSRAVLTIEAELSAYGFANRIEGTKEGNWKAFQV
jgi:hypothetical protein